MSIQLKCHKGPLLPEIDNWQYIIAVIRLLNNFFGSNFQIGKMQKNIKKGRKKALRNAFFVPIKKPVGWFYK